MASSAGGASSAGKKDSYVRADKIDLESLDIQLEKQLAKTWEKHKGKSQQGPREDWEIDLAKLDIRHVIARGTYGTVYRGTYDGQDVAGILYGFLLCSSLLYSVSVLWFTSISCFHFPVGTPMIFLPGQGGVKINACIISWLNEACIHDLVT